MDAQEIQKTTWSSQVNGRTQNGRTHMVTESALSTPLLCINEALLCKPDSISASLCRSPSEYLGFKAALHSFQNQNLKLAILAHIVKITSLKQQPRHNNSSQQDSFWRAHRKPELTCSATPQQEEKKGPVQPAVSSFTLCFSNDFPANSNIHKLFKAIYLSSKHC